MPGALLIVSMRRLLIWFVLLLGSAVLLGLVAHRIFWGYWMSRPTLSSSLSAATDLIGASALHFDKAGKPTIVPDRKGAFEDEASFCREDSDRNECLDGNILLGLKENELLDMQTPQVSQRLVEQAWTTIAPDLWYPKIQPRYKARAIPVNGIAVHFSTPQGEYLLLTRRTSEISNDRYTYLKALLTLSPGPRLEEQVYFFYEIAGLEGVGWLQFTVMSFLALLVLSLAWLLFQWLWRRITS